MELQLVIALGMIVFGVYFFAQVYKALGFNEPKCKCPKTGNEKSGHTCWKCERRIP